MIKPGNDKFHPSIKVTILLSILLFLIYCSPGYCEKSFPDDISLGGFKIRQNANVLKHFRIPTPVEEGGYHIIYNPSENVYIRTSLKYLAPKKWGIKTFRLSQKDKLFDKVRLNDHQMITGVSMKGFKTGEGIGLGDTKEKVLDIYGEPTNRKSSAQLEEWIYITNINKTRKYYSFVFEKGKVVAVNMGVD